MGRWQPGWGALQGAGDKADSLRGLHPGAAVRCSPEQCSSEQGGFLLRTDTADLLDAGSYGPSRPGPRAGRPSRVSALSSSARMTAMARPTPG